MPRKRSSKRSKKMEYGEGRTELSRCPACGSTARSAYATDRHPVEFHAAYCPNCLVHGSPGMPCQCGGVHSEEFTRIERRPCQCLNCGQWRRDTIYLNEKTDG